VNHSAFLREALQTLGKHTYREQAQWIIRASILSGGHNLKKTVENVSRLGWLAGEGLGEPPRPVVLRVRAPTANCLRSVYVEAYRQALESDPAPPVLLEASRRGDFALSLRGPVRGFWAGKFTRQQFVAGMEDALDRGLELAWREGIAVFGFDESELAPQDRSELELEVIGLIGGPHIDNLAERVWNNRKETGGKLTPLLDQVARVWGNRYDELVEKAKSIAGADQKAMWTLGIAEHCKSCLKLAGKVKRFSTWRELGILPRVAGAPYLECRGYQCKCTLKPTTRRLSPGPLPKLP